MARQMGASIYRDDITQWRQMIGKREKLFRKFVQEFGTNDGTSSSAVDGEGNGEDSRGDDDGKSRLGEQQQLPAETRTSQVYFC